MKTGSITSAGPSYKRDDQTLAKESTQRRKLYKLHSWIGFHLALIMSVILATGTIATISNEIDWIVSKALRVTPTETRVSWQRMTDAIKVHSPESTILTIEQLEGDYLANRARVKNIDGSQRYIYVDQWTGQVTGTTGLLTVQRFFRDLHRYMFMPNVIGLPIVTSMAFILGISLYTGLKTSRNRKTLMMRIRITKGTRVMVGDAHKAFGLWAVWFLVLMIITSIWYLAEFGAAVGGKRFEPSRPKISTEQLESFGPIIESPSTQDIISAASQAYPELMVTTISFPTRADQAITVLGDNGNPILRSRANRVFLNPQTLEPMKVQRSENIAWVAWLNEIADPLHFGFFGGLITKLIWFVFGLALTALSVTGVWLTWKRTKTKAVSRAQFATMPIFPAPGDRASRRPVHDRRTPFPAGGPGLPPGVGA
ncbi:MAG: PepSY domain-containing protein, partial [Arenicella sp.]|nr:PepSY domain-containing protein [Arenicella sp.]